MSIAGILLSEISVGDRFRNLHTGEIEIVVRIDAVGVMPVWLEADGHQQPWSTSQLADNWERLAPPLGDCRTSMNGISDLLAPALARGLRKRGRRG